MSPYGDESYGEVPYGDIGLPADVVPVTPATTAADKLVSLGRPTRLYYDPQYPLGKICFDYLPESAETFYVRSEKPLTELVTLDTEIVLPLEFKEALIYNLAIRVHTEEDTILSPFVYDIAGHSKTTLENLTAKDRLVRPLRTERLQEVSL